MCVCVLCVCVRMYVCVMCVCVCYVCVCCVLCSVALFDSQFLSRSSKLWVQERKACKTLVPKLPIRKRCVVVWLELSYEEDKRATSNVQDGLAFLLFFSFVLFSRFELYKAL